jgi:hypothetical protein
MGSEGAAGAHAEECVTKNAIEPTATEARRKVGEERWLPRTWPPSDAGATVYRMATRDLADPDWEPSDEDFAELLRHAADDVAEVRAEVARRLKATIAAARKPSSVDPGE